MDSSRLTAWRERVPRLSWSHRSAGFHQRGERSEAADKAALACRRTGRNKGKLQQIRCTAPPDRHRQDAVNCRSVCRGMQAPAIRRSCRRSERMEPLSSPRRVHSYVLPGIHETGRARKGMHVCRQPSPSLPSSAPGTQKGPLTGALVSFSLVRPEPDTVIGTTRRFQPWRELPSWLRAGGSVR